MGQEESRDVQNKFKEIEEKEDNDIAEIVNRNSFDFLSIIGRGGFGKVWKVFHKKHRKEFAMKEMSKAKIIDKKSEKSVKSERDLLAKMNHPFIVNMHFSFQDNDNLYLVMDLLTGGDLRYHICKRRRFNEEQSKFFISCILLGLEYCHTNHIIHRDIKPENLVLDANGYVHVTDFGIAKIQQPNNAKETSGTPGYMSPEVMCAQNHTIAVDYFALGVMGYEFMKGVRPYLGKSRKEIKEKIIAKQVQIKKNEIKEGWSKEAADCINRLLQRKPSHRLGLHGSSEVKNHPWFQDYPWKELYNKKLISPFRPPDKDNYDYKYCNDVEKQGINTKQRYAEIMERINYITVFQSYLYYDRFEMGSVKDKIICFINVHEKMYGTPKMEHNRNNTTPYSELVSLFKRNYNRIRIDNLTINIQNNGNNIINSGYNNVCINNDNNNNIEISSINKICNNGKMMVNHGRAVSAFASPFEDAYTYLSQRRFVKNELNKISYKNFNEKKRGFGTNNIYVPKKSLTKNKTTYGNALAACSSTSCIEGNTCMSNTIINNNVNSNQKEIEENKDEANNKMYKTGINFRSHL